MIIAVWSGPRNLSTALMYSFASRSDTEVRDEPFYAPYLAATGADHPMAQDILDHHERDARKVAASFKAGPRREAAHLYLKLMTHHVLAETPLDWADEARHVHLIRHPVRVLKSYEVKRQAPTLDDIGVPQQAALYDRFGGVVVDSADIRTDPRGVLGALCAVIGLQFDPTMLNWASGGHPADGIWARHWYSAVHRSTGFAGPEGPLPILDGDLASVAEKALPFYENMRARALDPVA